ncbi:hypothetical protein AB0I28_21010 [Phytomonospora sp. NPDC050363]|uniref:hypothetical protein n=1 Tax=Phytomonospora sp. NPDC050363 TaxID=3155642 RepID=UPI0034017984
MTRPSIYRPTHFTVGRSDERVTVTAYVECLVPPGEPVPAWRPRSETECVGAAFEQGPFVTLLPVDLVDFVGRRMVIDGSNGAVLEPY